MTHAARARRLARPVSLWALAALALAMIGPVAQPARAASGRVLLELTQAEAISRNADSIFPWWAPQDFYPKVAILGGSAVTGPEIGQRDWAAWDPPVQAVLDIPDIDAMTSNIVRGNVELWDADDVDADDLFDINPAPGRNLPLEFDVCTLRFQRSGDGARFSTMVWMPQGNESDAARVQVRMRTGDGRPFLPNNVAIADISPVQAVYHPRYVIEGKPTALMIELTSSHPGSVEATLNVSLSDGISTVSDSKTVVVPPEGTRVFFFDGIGGAAPYRPLKQPNFQHLRYSVAVNVPADATAPDPSGPFPNCIATQDNTLDGVWPMARTHSPSTLYLPWDWRGSIIPGEELPPPSAPSPAQAAATFVSNDRHVRAIFPISDTLSAVFPGFATSPKSTLEPAPTIIGWSIAANMAGIDRVVLMSRRGWFASNAGRLTFGAGAAGMSLAEWAPHAVIAEQGLSEVAGHELGHTYRLSRRPCSTGGLGEAFFLAGCRDEYNHAPADGRPYLGSGYDVRGQVFPTGSGGVPGTREVRGVTNFMDTTPAVDGGPYDRWIDNLSYDWLSEELKLRQDPELISLSGYIRVPGGLESPDGSPLDGHLFPSYRYMGIPDVDEAPLGSAQGEGTGQFFVRLVTTGGERVYRFTPGADLEGSSTDGYGFFSFSVPWDPKTTRVELVGPGKPGDLGNEQGSVTVLASRVVSKAAPSVGKPRAASAAPAAAGSNMILIGWDQADGDAGDELRAMVFLIPPAGAGDLARLGRAIPFAVNVEGGSLAIDPAQLAGQPGAYGVRVVVSDGVNSSTVEAPAVFTVQERTYLPQVAR